MHPPIDDPTLPYHSTAYLKGHLAHSGFTDVSMRDVNIEYVNYCLEEQSVKNYYEEADNLIRRFESRPELGYAEQEAYYRMWAASRIDPADLRQAAEGMRNLEEFLDFPTYLKNLNLILRYFNFLGSLSYPAEISNFRQMTRARYSLYNLGDLTDRGLREKTCRPFGRFFQERLAFDPELNATDCFGISIVYDHQLLHAFYFAQMLKQRWPEKLVLLGGTAISQMYKHMAEKQEMKRFFDLCDAIVVGEGETAICEIAAAGTDLSKYRFIPNTITYDRKRDELRLPANIHYENVTTLGRPTYHHPWELYLAPEKGINYAPTRGCYWNRCTFCDYGLNDNMPTSPWRERKVEQVVEDLQSACRDEQIKYVYFAVDVMAPSYIARLSDAMAEANLDIKWSAEMRMEKIFSAERCRKMARSGCVCISFGMESGNQRILDLIDKGTKVQFMGETMKNFSEAGVAVQLMAFTDFPTETPEEKNETFDFIRQHDDYWAAGGLGTFLLTGTSMIAKDPERFGIKIIQTEDADIRRALAYKVEAGSEQKLILSEESDESFNADGGAFPPVLGRPWAGGTDTLHSMIYYNAYGRLFFRQNSLEGTVFSTQGADESRTEKAQAKTQADETLLDCTLRVAGRINESPFNISRIFEHGVPYKKHISLMLQVPIEPTYSSFRQWRSGVEPIPREEGGPSYWLTTGNKCVKLDKLVYRLITLGASRQVPLRNLLSGFKPELQARLLEYLKGLEASGMLIFDGPERVAGTLRRNVRLEDKDISRAINVMPHGKMADGAQVKC